MRPPPKLGSCLRQSVQLLMGRSTATIALGAAIVLSLLSVCFGIGVLMTPWLLCELLALQLAEALGHPLSRSRAWIGACAILLGAVLLTSSVGWLTWLGLGTDAAPLEPEHGTAWALVLRPGGLLAVASAFASLVFVLPFLYAPLILIEGRAQLAGAVLESARVVAVGGMLPHLLLSLVANVVQASPLLIAALSASLLSEHDSTGLWALLSLPLLSLTVPIGQGMLVSAYVERRAEVADLRRTRMAGRPPGALVAVWAVIVAAPLLSFSMLGASFVRPSRLVVGHLPVSAELIASFVPLRGEQHVHPEGTALEIAISPRAVRVVASDGGGVGGLPLRSETKIEALRIARVRDSYRIELMQAGIAYLTSIDRSGVRLDDDLRARLLDRVPSWALLLMLLSLLSTAGALLPVLAALAELRRLYALEPGPRPPGRELSERRARTISRALALALLLAPLAALSLYWGLRSVLG
jgi:hypothetical protein